MRNFGDNNRLNRRAPNDTSTMVTRLQCVQAAVEQQIERLSRESPSIRVALVTFSNEVILLGDGSQPPVTIAGDKLLSSSELQKLARAFPPRKPLHESKEHLLKCLWELEEGGGTALGPALQISIDMAGQNPRSSVVLCTDGLANVGVGALDEKESKYRLFYVECAEQAKLQGVIVSVVSIKGEECNLERISTVCEQTGGKIERVDPAQLIAGGEFSAVLGAPIVAYQTMAMVILHRGMRFQDEFEDEDNRNWLVKDIGNVVAGKEMVFAYNFRSKDECDLTGVKQVPFQIQLIYTRPDGMKCVRVATSLVTLTEDKKEAEKDVDMEMLAVHSVAKAARLAKEGDYEEAQREAKQAEELLSEKKE